VKLFVALACCLMFGCTDAKIASIGALGTSAKVECFSGGKTIYKGVSTGRVASLESSDGWEFKDAATMEFIRVSGTCVVRN